MVGQDMRLSEAELAAGREFEDVLGPLGGRYFGGGFRRVEHAYQTLALEESSSSAFLRGTGSARYPEDWSVSASGIPREVHLSSFDAIALTAAALRDVEPASARIRTLLSRRVRRVRVKCPARPVLPTRGVNVELRCTDVPSGDETRVSSRVGRFSVEVDIGNRPFTGLPVDLQLHDSNLSGALGTGIVLREGDGVVETTQKLTPGRTRISCVEELAMFGQLSQIAVYVAKGVDRRSAPNLWLRRLALERSEAQPVSPVEAQVRVIRDRHIRLGLDEVADLTLAAETSYGAQAEASFGFRVPS